MKRKIFILLGLIITVLVILFSKDKISSIKEEQRKFLPNKTKSNKTIEISTIPLSLQRPRENNSKIFSESLKTTNFEMPLLFGENVSEKSKQLILKDFDLLFKDNDKYELYDWNVKNKKRIKKIGFYGDSHIVDKRLYLVQSQPPALIHDRFGEIAKINGKDQILIFQDIVKAYEKAGKFKEKHESEYEKLADFVYMMTNATEDNPITTHPKEVIYMPDAPAMKKLEEDPSLIPKAQKFYSKTTRLRMPSILEFKSAPVTMQVKGITLLAEGYTLKDDSNIPSSKIALVYHNRKWKILGAL